MRNDMFSHGLSLNLIGKHFCNKYFAHKRDFFIVQNIVTHVYMMDFFSFPLLICSFSERGIGGRN